MSTRLLAAILILAATPAAHQPPAQRTPPPAEAGVQPQARRGPVPLDGAMAYQIWMRSFTPEGTLRAATARLAHVAGLGATIVYLSPINLQSTAGGYSNPYRIKDHDAIDPEYGTDADLRAFTAEAHRLGLKVLMDVVYYHTAPDSVLMQRPEFYLRKDGAIVLGNWRLPRPDFANPGVRQYFIDNLRHWVERGGVDGFRCDVSYGVPTDFWEEARAALDRVNPSLLLLAESENPPEMLRAFDISYNFSWQTALRKVFIDGEPAAALRGQWEAARARFPAGTRFLRAADNHDQPRAVVGFSARGAQAAAVINFTMDGIPFLYNGQEIGDTVATDHQSHAPIRWEHDRREGMTGSGLARGQQALIAWHTRLFELRRTHAALTKGEVVWLDNSRPADVVTYLRRAAGQTVLVAVNVSNRKLSVSVPVSAPIPSQVLLDGPGSTLRAAAGGAALDLGAFGYLVAGTPP